MSLTKIIKGWRRGEKCDVPITDNEHEILDNFEAEVERGIMHTNGWTGRMAQLEKLREVERQGDGTRWEEPG